ncbi:hypothetical protein IHE61_20880 [Streptomyces sp. GKU 257-1]|nr:hypothetical protein [Streptomyces sp. GKU 257-1]
MSRHLLSGQRVPAPAPTTEPDDGHRAATGPLTPLHDLTGQQFDSPAPDPDRPTSVGLSLEVTSAADWLVLRRSEVAQGALRRTENVTALTLEFTNAELQRLYPSTVLAVQPELFPEPLPAGEPAPVTYGLDHRIELQSPLPLPLTTEAARATGNASLWPFPAALRARAAMDQETPYDVVRTAAPGSRPRPGDVLSGVTFATTVTFGIRRVGALAHAYELSGVDTVDRDVLLLLRERLATAGGARAFLAVAPPPDAPSSSGLAVLAADEEATYLLKTNESTVSKPPAGDVAAAGRQPHAARLCEVTDFLVLLWQGSVVGGSGYYLGYRTRTGEDLPPGAFDPEGRARLTLLVVLDDRASPAPLGRTLLPCDTCALVAPGLDPSAAVLYVEAAEPDAETTTVPVLPQGTVGFTTTLPRPPADDAPPSRAARMFSQLTYGSAAIPGGHGLPVSPSDNDGGGRPAWQRDRLARARRSGRNVSAPGPVHWRYQQALPHVSTVPSPAPAVGGLPAPDKDPYRGIEGERTPGVAITLGFCDVLGNLGISTDTGDAAPYVVDAPLGYRDVLLAVTQWPALSLSYSVAPSATGPRLSITLAPQAGATAPEPGDSPTRALDAARRQSERYAAAYYQLAGDRVTATVRTTLVPGPDGTPAPLPVDAAPLWRYAAASHLAAAAAGSSTPVTVTGSAADVTARHGTSYQALASANAYNEIRVLFDADPPAVPAYAVVVEKPQHGRPHHGARARLAAPCRRRGGPHALGERRTPAASRHRAESPSVRRPAHRGRNDAGRTRCRRPHPSRAARHGQRRVPRGTASRCRPQLGRQNAGGAVPVLVRRRGAGVRRTRPSHGRRGARDGQLRSQRPPRSAGRTRQCPLRRRRRRFAGPQRLGAASVRSRRVERVRRGSLPTGHTAAGRRFRRCDRSTGADAPGTGRALCMPSGPAAGRQLRRVPHRHTARLRRRAGDGPRAVHAALPGHPGRTRSGVRQYSCRTGREQCGHAGSPRPVSRGVGDHPDGPGDHRDHRG